MLLQGNLIVILFDSFRIYTSLYMKIWVKSSHMQIGVQTLEFPDEDMHLSNVRDVLTSNHVTVILMNKKYHGHLIHMHIESLIVY